jgi:alkanesulfonate monooxygenase
VWFINGQPLADVERLIEGVRSHTRIGPPLRFGLSAFVIARETSAEAEAAYAHLADLAEKDAPIRARQVASTDPRVVMKHTHGATTPLIGTNCGTAAGLVGSYDEVALHIRAFHAVGIELFMLQFQPFESEMRRFAQEIFPRAAVRSGDPSRNRDPGAPASARTRLALDDSAFAVARAARIAGILWGHRNRIDRRV